MLKKHVFKLLVGSLLSITSFGNIVNADLKANLSELESKQVENIMLQKSNNHKYIAIYGHRGARGLSPENSLPAYNTCLNIGVDYVDMDVHLTKDKVIVVTHDFTLNPDLTRDTQGEWIDAKNPPLIKDLTFAQLQKYDIGQLKPITEYSNYFPYQHAVNKTKISSLEDVINYVKKHSPQVKFQIEIKTDPEHPDYSFSPQEIAQETVKVLQKTQISDKTELQSFDWRVLKEIQKLDPSIATAYLTDKEISDNMKNFDPKVAGLWSDGKLLKDYKNSIPYMIAKLGGKIWGPESKELNAKLVQEAHYLGLKVVPWSMVDSLDDPKEINRMIDIGVDGIISDRPDIVRGILAARGYTVPKF